MSYALHPKRHRAFGTILVLPGGSCMIQFEADSDGLRASFAGFGDINTYFDLVKNRGMIFITYVSLPLRLVSI